MAIWNDEHRKLAVDDENEILEQDDYAWKLRSI